MCIWVHGVGVYVMRMCCRCVDMVCIYLYVHGVGVIYVMRLL